MSLEIVKPGLLTTVQDLGRFGFLSQGVLQSGVMDPISMRTANLLVGNAEDEAVLELTISGPEILFSNDAVIAVCGAGMTPVVNGNRFSLGVPIYIPSGQTLTFNPAKTGMRAYVAIAGGLDVTEIMNSKSTYLRAQFGGYKGRALQKGDSLELGALSTTSLERKHLLAERSHGQAVALKWGANHLRIDDDLRYRIRAFPGTHFDRFTEESQEDFFTKSYTLSTQSDRMGFRFQSEHVLKLKEEFNVLSSAVAFGTVQVPNEGKPMILMADRQTTGGYPRIAQVAQADITKLAQLRPNENLHFERITFEEAEALYFQQEDAMKERASGIQLQWEEVNKSNKY